MQISKKIIYSGLLVIFLIGMAGYINVGFSSLMMADDYCFLSVVGNEGFIQSQIDTYINVMVIAGNRYAATFTISILGYLGEKIIPVFPLITIFSLFLALTFAIIQIMQYFLARKEILLSALMAAFFVNILLYAAPSHFQNIYWFAGIITYTTPLVIYLFLLGIFFYCLRVKERRTWFVIFMFVIAVFSAGFSETAAVAFFVGTLFLLMLLMVVTRSEKCELWKFIPILGITLGMVLLIISPSGRSRASSTHSVELIQIESGLWILSTALRFGADFIKYTISGYILPVIVSVLSFAAFGYLLRGDRVSTPWFTRKKLMINLFLFLSTYFIVAASISPSVFAFSTYPNVRSRMVGIFFLLAGVALIALYNGYHFPVRSQLIEIGALAGLVLVGVYVLRASWIEQNYKAELQTRRDQWIVRNEFSENAVLSGKEQITVFGIDSIETIEDFNPVCFRKYYDLVHVEIVTE